MDLGDIGGGTLLWSSIFLPLGLDIWIEIFVLAADPFWRPLTCFWTKLLEVILKLELGCLWVLGTS